jgi:glycosyltransferase involved in cell wall biosynthesis
LLSYDLNIKLVLVLQVLDKSYFLDIKKFIRDNFLESKIIILSNLFQNQLPKLYKNAEVYVFTSYCEVFGLTSLEAMSQSTPVVISNTSALPEINKKAAQYFNPDDIKDIKNKLKKVILDKKLRVKLVNNGIELLKKYNVSKSVKKTFNIIENLK